MKETDVNQARLAGKLIFKYPYNVSPFLIETRGQLLTSEDFQKVSNVSTCPFHPNISKKRSFIAVWGAFISSLYFSQATEYTRMVLKMLTRSCKPVIIQALVDLAALIRPLLNTSFNLGLRTKLLAPPVTEMTKFGISKFHLSSINFKMSCTSVSWDTRTYCRTKEKMGHYIYMQSLW